MVIAVSLVIYAVVVHVAQQMPVAQVTDLSTAIYLTPLTRVPFSVLVVKVVVKVPVVQSHAMTQAQNFVVVVVCIKHVIVLHT